MVAAVFRLPGVSRRLLHNLLNHRWRRWQRWLRKALWRLSRNRSGDEAGTSGGWPPRSSGCRGFRDGCCATSSTTSGNGGTQVTIRPVIDLNDELSTDAYVPTEELKEQIRLRYRECAFPSCRRQARSCDLDHIIEFPDGPTASWNLAPLCRGHHRLKTFTAWTYTWVPGIGFVWTDPGGRRHIN